MSGNELWTRQTGPGLGDSPGAIAAGSGDIYVTGLVYVQGEGQVDGPVDFVRKYDANGTELWTRQLGTYGDGAGVEASSVAVDSTGIYVAGSIGTAFPRQSSSGDGDAYVRKYDPAGNELWTRQFGTASADSVLNVVVGSGGIYVVGRTEGTFPPNANSGTGHTFVRKYDPAGNDLWTRQFGINPVDYASASAADASGIYIAGGATDATPGQTANDPGPAFVRMYDPNGTELWTFYFGSKLGDFATSITASSPRIYVGGQVLAALPGQTRSGEKGDAFVMMLAP